MKKIFLFVFMLTAAFSFGQKIPNLGQGVVKVDYQKLPVLKFYTDTLDKKSARTVIIVKNKDGMHDIKDAEKTFQWFAPEALFIEYEIFIIRVDTIVGKWLKVYTNNNEAQTMWTKMDATETFISWQKFLLTGITSVDKAPGFNLDIKELPTDKAKTIKKIEEGDCFKVIEIKGEWMHIKTNVQGECNESKHPVKSGWLKWKINNKLSIGYGMVS